MRFHLTPSPRGRQGISLLEVLISVFVLTVGILGLAALIPIGRFEVQEASKLDRASTLGKQAYRELLIRGLLKPYAEDPTTGAQVCQWVYFDSGSLQFNDVINTGVQPYTFNNVLPPFAIDPAIFADPRNYDAVWQGDPNLPVPNTFPYNYNNDVSAVGLNTATTPMIARLSLAPMVIKGTTLTEQQQETSHVLVDRVFRGRDDLAFFLPDDKDARPVQQFNISGTATSDQFTQQAPAQRLSAATTGDYSWMLTVSPTLGEVFDGATQTYLPQRMRSYVVSVVVFYKRPIVLLGPDANEAPAERTVAVTFGGSGVGGGSVHLESDKSIYLRDLKPNQWILLTSKMAGSGTTPTVAKWYRIVSVDDGSEPNHRDVTLDGPDWNPAQFQSLGDNSEGEPIHATAAIFDGVVAVYDKTMQLDLTGN